MADPGIMGQSWQQIQDFLASLYNTPGAAAALQAAPWSGPNGQGMPGEPNTPGNILPGGGVMSYPATTPGTPSMGYPAVSGPLAAAPQQSYDPLSSIQAPAAVAAPAVPPPRPAAATPAAASAPLPAPKAASKGAKMKPDLGMNPRFNTFQSQVPGGARGGPLSSNPIFTALNLGS